MPWFLNFGTDTFALYFLKSTATWRGTTIRRVDRVEYTSSHWISIRFDHYYIWICSSPRPRKRRRILLYRIKVWRADTAFTRWRILSNYMQFKPRIGSVTLVVTEHAPHTFVVEGHRCLQHTENMEALFNWAKQDLVGLLRTNRVCSF